MAQPHVIIVGAGLSGLSCARTLQQAGIHADLLEASDAVGGRVQTDEVDGFLLDRGFQVLLTAYPEARAAFDYDALDLRSFHSGALVYFGVRFRRLGDPLRHPGDLASTLFSGVGSVADKWRVLRMRGSLARTSLEALWDREDLGITRALRERWGFSEEMIHRFFRPFLGGITLDPDLAASSRILEFVFRMMAEGQTAVPARGMGRLTLQLAAGLPAEQIRLNCRVEQAGAGGVTLADGSRETADAVVIATEGPAAGSLLPSVASVGSRAVTCLYYAAERAPIEEPILLLDGIGCGPATNVAVMSRVSPAYAPAGAELISVSVLGNEVWEENALDVAVRAQMRTWFGDAPLGWRHLRTYRIPHALPDQTPPALSPARRPVRIERGLYVCGDHRTDASINGAMLSGRLAAEAVLHDLS